MVWDVPMVQKVPIGAGAGTQHSADDKGEGDAKCHPHARAHRCEGRWGQDWAALRYHHQIWVIWGWCQGGERLWEERVLPLQLSPLGRGRDTDPGLGPPVAVSHGPLHL